VVPLNGLLRNAKLFLRDLVFDPEIGELVSQPLGLYPQSLAFLLADLDLLFQ
jgi:hypothetical protein